MDVVNFFGKILAEKSGLKKMPCSGMIRLALKDMKKDPEMYDIREVKNLIQKFLRDRLEKAGFKDIDILIQELLKELFKNQSLLIMTADSKD